MPTQLRQAPATPSESVSLAGRRVSLEHPLFQIRDGDIEASRTSARRPVDAPASATWFVPYFRHLGYAGISTIFRFISGFAERGTEPRIVIYDNPDVTLERVRAEIGALFPKLASAEIVVFDLDRDEVADLPATDLGICTFWASAYLLLRFNRVGRKLYFVQDYEPLFYVAGSTYALAESTYRFGFTGIVNTPGLLQALRERHEMEGVSFVPAVDGRYYHRAEGRPAGPRLRVFFYMRPGQARNAFELELVVIRRIVRTYGDRIEIVTAGAEWDEGDFDLNGRITNLGLLDGPRAVGHLYRTCDIGCMYSLSRHPSYQPFEFMASGMATVTNRNEATLWFLHDGVNCLLTEPSPAAMTEKVGMLIEDAALRERISAGGLASVGNDWGHEIDHVWRSLGIAGG